jgi:hypothetical protein
LVYNDIFLLSLFPSRNRIFHAYSSSLFILNPSLNLLNFGDMCSPTNTQGIYPPSSDIAHVATRQLPELAIPDTIRDDILHAKILASNWVIHGSPSMLEEAKALLKSIRETIEEKKREEGESEPDDNTWTLKVYNEIAVVYGLLKMTEQEQEISTRLLVTMEERRGRDDMETLLIVQSDALRHWDWGNLEEAVLLFERAQDSHFKSFGEDNILVISNTTFLHATATALSLKYAGEGKDSLSAEKRRQSDEASKRVANWTRSSNIGDISDPNFLLQSTRQIIQDLSYRTFESGLIHPSFIPNQYLS